MKEKKCLWECPKCGSTDLENIDFESEEDDCLYKPAKCRDCGCELKEKYKYVCTYW